jgi:hypothetical protein
MKLGLMRPTELQFQKEAEVVENLGRRSSTEQFL